MKNFYSYVPGKDPDKFIETYKKDGDELVFNIDRYEVKGTYTNEYEERIENLMDSQIDDDICEIAIDNIYKEKKKRMTEWAENLLSRLAVLITISLFTFSCLPLFIVLNTVTLIYIINGTKEFILENMKFSVLIQDIEKNQIYKKEKEKIKKNLTLEHIPHILINKKSLEIFIQRINNNKAPLNYQVLDKIELAELENIIEYLDYIEEDKNYVKKI